jgi:GT2 family glycosyltransferase
VVFESNAYWTICDNLGWFHEHLVSASPGTRDLLPSLNLCVRRAVIEAVGAMNEIYPRAAGEDAEWTTRMRQAGYALRFLPDAVVHHHPSRATLLDIWRHAYIYGRYSVKVNRAFFDFLRPSFVFRSWWVLLLALPVLSLGAAVRIYLKDRAAWRYVYAFPGVWLSKVAWILGAMRALR